MNTTATKYIAYIRVSTRKQGVSGLGLEAQRDIILRDVGQTFMEFVEVASGTKDREILQQAVEACKRHGAVLVVAKVDRLTRSVKLACDLLESRISLRVCGMPDMTTMVFQMLCVIAEEEARLISQRTKAALQAAKERGVKLGSAREGHWDGRQRGPKPGSKRASSTPDPQLVAQCKQLRDSGLSWEVITERINAQGYRAPRGGEYSKGQLHRMVTSV